MAKKTAALVAELTAKGDGQFQDGQFYYATSTYLEALGAQIEVNSGQIGSADKPLMEKLFEASFATSFTYEKHMAYCLKMARTLLYIAEREHGIDSPELIQPLERLVMLYDLDGAHMLAIEVKQRIDDIKAQQAA
jgi:hypothetical protein